MPVFPGDKDVDSVNKFLYSDTHYKENSGTSTIKSELSSANDKGDNRLYGSSSPLILGSFERVVFKIFETVSGQDSCGDASQGKNLAFFALLDTTWSCISSTPVLHATFTHPKSLYSFNGSTGVSSMA
uniref:Peptidase S1 domain-containing protein n=1 Tax=Macrostomum lignano TaxID=282301 RepID=A0A1I8I2V5_9PLAT